jgi:hypothetical protein
MTKLNIRVLVVILTVVSLVRGISPPSKPVPNGLGVSPSAPPSKPVGIAPPKPTNIPVSTNPGIVPPLKPTLVNIGSNLPPIIPTLPGIIAPPKPIIPTMPVSINFGIPPPPKPTIIPAVPISINPGIILPPKPTLPPLIAPPKPTRTFSFGLPITKPTNIPTSVVKSPWTVVITTTVTSCDWDAYNRNIVYPREPRIRASYPYPFVAPQVHPYQPINLDLNPKDLKKINKLVDKVVASKLKQFVREYDDPFDDDF